MPARTCAARLPIGKGPKSSGTLTLRLWIRKRILCMRSIVQVCSFTQTSGRNLGRPSPHCSILSFTYHLHKPCREYIKEPFAEFLGTFILVMFGAGVNCQVVLSSSPNVASTQRGVCFFVNSFFKILITEDSDRIPCLSVLVGQLVLPWVFSCLVEFQAVISIQR